MTIRRAQEEGPELPTNGALPETTLREFGGTITASGTRDGKGYVRIDYSSVRPEHCNPRGTLQGGMAAVFLDDAMSYAALTQLGDGARFATTTMSLSYLKAVDPGAVCAEGRVVRLGRRTGFLEGDLFDEHGELCIRASCAVTMLR